MKNGYLSQFFVGVAYKQLSAVESDILASHQHEFDGVANLKKLLGRPTERTRYPAKFLYLTDYEDDPIVEEGFLTWYDSRQRGREAGNTNRSEYRLYFPSNQASSLANPGDDLIIAKLEDDSLLAIIAERDTTIAGQLKWLFGFSDSDIPRFSIREELETEQDRIGFTTRLVLESIGIEVEETNETLLDDMLRRFGGLFPSTCVFSEYTRTTLPDYHPTKENCDEILMAWVEREEILFRTFEKHLVGDRLKQGFTGDVEGFLKYSLSVQNRRKSRAGYSLENHLKALLDKLAIGYSHTPITENRAKPDFLFPSIKHYHDKSFPELYLTMLGVKTTCKDRWRQVLTEADRIERKHLLTLEPAISPNQTNEMISKNLQLVLPRPLHYTYTDQQRNWLIDLGDFIALVASNQEKLHSL